MVCACVCVCVFVMFVLPPPPRKIGPGASFYGNLVPGATFPWRNGPWTIFSVDFAPLVQEYLVPGLKFHRNLVPAMKFQSHSYN